MHFKVHTSILTLLTVSSTINFWAAPVHSLPFPQLLVLLITHLVFPCPTSLDLSMFSLLFYLSALGKVACESQDCVRELKVFWIIRPYHLQIQWSLLLFSYFYPHYVFYFTIPHSHCPEWKQWVDHFVSFSISKEIMENLSPLNAIDTRFVMNSLCDAEIHSFHP